MSKLVTFICTAFDLYNEFSMMPFRSVLFTYMALVDGFGVFLQPTDSDKEVA